MNKSGTETFRDTGLDYLRSYSGVLSISEQIVNLTILIFILITGSNGRTYFLSGVSFTAAIITGFFIFIHISAMFYRKTSWAWIECIYVFSFCILYTLGASIVVSIFQLSYVAIAILGYIGAIFYFLDTLDKYGLATQPHPQYVWNMPVDETEHA